MAKVKRKLAHEEENQERWLLTYSDMITLLMALFMVLFSISSVNISKYRTLQQALREAFSGQILPGGQHLQQTGQSQSAQEAPETAASTSVLPFSIESPVEPPKNASEAPVRYAQQEQRNFEELEREVRAYIKAHGLQSAAFVSLQRKGLVITLLTDNLLFASGSAHLSPAAYPLLTQIASLINLDPSQPVSVEGNTDSVPISNQLYPSNWELSSARASRVVRFLIAHGVSPARLAAIGYAEQRPLATNATPEGRAHNRRVEIVLERLYPEPPKP